MDFEERMQMFSQLVEVWCPDEHKNKSIDRRLIYAFLNVTTHLEDKRGESKKTESQQIDSGPIFIS